MKVILTADEVKKILLDKVNQNFATYFNDVSFDGYSPFKTATFEFVQPEAPEAQEVTE